MTIWKTSNQTTRSVGSSGNDEIVWDDLRVPLTQGKQGVLDKPDFDFTNIGYLFPQNDATEIIYIIAQMPHKYKEGSDIYPHLHWQQSAATAVTWVMEYKWFGLGVAVPAAFTTLSSSSTIFTYTSGNLSQITAFTPIDGTGYGISSLLLVKLYRNDNVTTGDVLAWDFDIHYQIDTIGSLGEFTKTE